MEIPVYNIMIDDTVIGLDGISFVANPAIETNFVFQSEAKPINLFQYDQFKHLVEGPILIPDQLIIRVDESNNPYYIKWSAETIYNAMLSAFKHKVKATVNHTTEVSDVKLLSLYIDKDGVLIAKYKVNDNDLWDKIVRQEIVGFSIEAEVRYKK